MTPFDLKQWQIAKTYDKKQAADVFGMSVRQWDRLLSGDSPIPPYVVIIMHLLTIVDELTKGKAA